MRKVMGNHSFRRSTVDFDGPVDLRHFNLRRSIGKGAYGKVCIVEKKDTKQLYALKYMNKARMIRTDTVYHVLREQDILIQLDHSNIIKLWFTFQDEEDVFMVSDLLLGGDLGYHIEKYGRLSFDRVKLYVAEVGMALDYLKSKSIIHRDVKPANLLLNEKGHVLLNDFNVACIVAHGVAINSVSGTRPYMAPEMFAPPPQGYSYPVDWWSLGVTAYQLLRAQLPFNIGSARVSYGRIADHISEHRNLHMSSTWDDKIRDFLYRLIQPNISRRITSVEDLKKCTAVYEGENWVAIKSQTFIPPFVPPKDKICCDPSFELEEMIIEPNPIHEKHQRLKRRRYKSTNEPVDPASDVSHLFMPYNRIRSLDTTGKPLSVEKEVMEDGAKHNKVSAGKRSNNESITAQPLFSPQEKCSSSDAATPIKQRVPDDDSIHPKTQSEL